MSSSQQQPAAAVSSLAATKKAAEAPPVAFSMEELADMHAAKRLDVGRAGQGVWLVKVPKYLAELWAAVADNEEVAKLCVQQSPGGKSEVLLLNSESVMAAHADTHSGHALPREHKFLMQSKQQGELGLDMHVVCQEPAEPVDAAPRSRMAVWGKVKTRAECRPADGVAYMSLKRRQLEQTNKPAREVEVLKRAVRNSRPVADHAHNIEYEKRRAAEGKRSRSDREDVLQTLLAAFEKHQYYNIRDLEQLTQQPLPYLKEILKDVASYNMKAPHKNLWELKPEFRHYKSSVGEAATAPPAAKKPATAAASHSQSNASKEAVEHIHDDDDEDDESDDEDNFGLDNAAGPSSFL